MNPVAHQALLKLLSQAERAWANEAQDKVLTLAFTPAKLPTYFQFPTSEQRAQCNADLGLAELAQSITIEWDARSGEKRQISRIRLVSAEKLAQLLGHSPRWAVVEAATALLSPMLPTFAVLGQVIAAWTRGTTVRRTSAQDATHWLDACRVILHRRASGDEDLPYRGLSVALFDDSKRLESLWPMLDVLLQDSLEGAARSEEDICGELGIVKHPSTFLIAGPLQIVYGGEPLDIRAPYLGLSPTHINAVGALDGIDTLLSVENLTTFHELAKQSLKDHRCAVIYTAGMPSPSWLRLYGLLLKALPVRAAALHWGDIDAGGFRIADRLASACVNMGRTLALYGMAGELIRQDGETKAGARKALDSSELNAIRKICEARSWPAQWAFVSQRKMAYEQEGMPALLPAPLPFPCRALH